MGVFEDLKGGCAVEWEGYVGHEFVELLGSGKLPEGAFRYYLRQDYVFLFHFARAYGLGVFKARSMLDAREAAASAGSILGEMGMHEELCLGWGISAAELEATQEDAATTAYTRYVLDCGMRGDLADLHTALSPCVVGYAEIGERLLKERGAEGKYGRWIEEYGGAEYQATARAARERLDRLCEGFSSVRMEELARTFREATRLETSFWEMGLTGG